MGRALRMVFALALLGGLLYGCYVFIAGAWKALNEANPQLGGAIATGGAALIVGVFTVVGNKWLERRATVAKELRDKKCPIYEDLLRFMFKVFLGTQVNKPVTKDEMTEFLFDFTQKLLVWGSDEVVNAWGEFRGGAGGDAKVIVLLMENVIKAIRRDLGHRNVNLPPGALVGLFITDARQVLGSS